MAEPSGHPIPFIVNKDGEFVVAPESEAFLKSLSGRKIGVVCIVGKYRTGKSYLINKVLLQRTNKDGFKVGPTVNPCTKGLWIWNQSVKGQIDGEDIDLIVMDCEGFGGMDESQNHDTRIFLFALLLSSYFVYNSVGSIDETALQTLSLVVNLAKDVRMRASDQDMPSEEEIAENFPSFLWIVRDFTLRLVDGNDNPITSKQYLENALALVKGCNEAAENKNRIRRLLKHFFRDRDCVTMVRPVELEQDLQKLDSMPDKYLREEFLTQAQNIRNKVFKKTKPKSVGGKVVTSEMLLHLANGYAVAVNRGKVPTIESAWNYVCKEKANDTARECLAQVDKIVNTDETVKALLADDKDWKGEVRRILMAKFNQAKFADSVELKEKQEQLEKDIAEKLDSISKNMLHVQSSAAERWLDDKFQPISDLIKQDQLNSPRKAYKLLDELESNFHTENKNIPQKAREKLVKNFRQEKEAKLLSAVVRTKEEEQKKEKEKQAALIQTLEKEAANTKLHLEEERHKLLDRIKELEETQLTLKANEMSLKEKMVHMQERVEFEKQKAQERELMHKASFEEVQRRADAEVESLRQKLTEKDAAAMKSALDKEKAEMLLNQEKALAHEHIEKLNRRNKELEGKIEEAKTREETLATKVRELHRSEELKELRDQLEAAKGKRRLLENELGEVKVEKQYLENQLRFYREQVDDNKKLQETLLGALQQQLRVDDDNTAAELLATNKSLGASLGKAEARVKALEAKVSRYRLYKQMVAGAKAFQCKETGKLIPKNAFLAHLQHLDRQVKPNDRDSDDSISKTPEQAVQITQTMIKECPETGKAFTEYLLQIKYARGFWKISRTYREFCELNQQLIQTFPGVKMPASANQILGFGVNVSSLVSTKKRTLLEDRRVALEEYINDLLRIPQVAASGLLREFLKIDVYVDEGGVKEGRSPLGVRDNSMAELASAYKGTSVIDTESGYKGMRGLKENRLN